MTHQRWPPLTGSNLIQQKLERQKQTGLQESSFTGLLFLSASPFFIDFFSHYYPGYHLWPIDRWHILDDLIDDKPGIKSDIHTSWAWRESFAWGELSHLPISKSKEALNPSLGQFALTKGVALSDKWRKPTLLSSPSPWSKRGTKLRKPHWRIPEKNPSAWLSC